MARTTVEGHALSEGRLEDLAEELGMEKYQTIGLLVMFWHDSQSRCIWRGSRAQLERCIPEKKRRAEVFDALVRNDYVSECRTDDGRTEYLVRGNKKHIDALEELKERQRTGGKKSGATRRKQPTDEEFGMFPPFTDNQPEMVELEVGDEVATSVAGEVAHEVIHTMHSTHSTHSTHSNQNNPNQSNTMVAPAPGAGRDLGRKVWESYSTAYRRRYGVEPVRNASVNGQLANLVKRLGGEAPDVAAFYVFHNSAFYVRAKHSVGPMLKDAEGLRTEWATGNRVTDQKAREVERMQTNSDNWDEAAMVLREKGGAKW